MIKPNLRQWQQLLAFGFGSGLSPKAPGTMGSIAALIFIPLLASMSGLELAIFLLAATIVGVYVCDYTAKYLQVHDDGRIVWDEFVGQWISLAPAFLLPAKYSQILVYLIAFGLFRFFDILKPWPISYCDKHVHGGLGIMLDDVLAGIAAAACLYVLMSLHYI